MKFLIKLWIIGVLIGIIVWVGLLVVSKDNSVAIKTSKTVCDLSSDSKILDEKIINKIIDNKNNIKFLKDNCFKLESESRDTFYMFKSEDNKSITIKIGFTSYSVETSNPELLKILNRIYMKQKLIREKEDQERILKAIGE